MKSSKILLVALLIIAAAIIFFPKSLNVKLVPPKEKPPGPPPAPRDAIKCDKIPRGAPYSQPEEYCQSATTGWCYSIGEGVDNPNGWFAITKLDGGCDTKPLCQDLGKVCGLSNIESLR